MTNTPIGGTHKPHLWLQYIELMVEGYTLSKIVKRLNIHLSTAFYWRHKVLNAVRSIGDSVLQGVIESDETSLTATTTN
jgi:transposase-like protein